MLNRREFLLASAASALAGCSSIEMPQARNAAAPVQTPAEPVVPPPFTPQFHVFSKMFQSPVTPSVDALCELMAKAGVDGLQWTVRPKGHVLPENVKTDLPKVVEAARRQGLKNVSICTAITTVEDPFAEEILKTAADCGITQFRPGYFFYDAKKETFHQSLNRIKAGFASLAGLAEKTGVKATDQNHSSWGPSVFGGLVWDVYECIRDLDPKYVGLEYDPMHAYFETNLSWSHGLELIAPWIGAVDLKDFHYQLSKKNGKDHAKFMCAAGEGIVPWKEVKRLLDLHKVQVPYIIHFEYAFDQTDLLKTVKGEVDTFKKIFG